ncbi:hypothetical protein NE237_006145 [Protea cynaroides]|uniref:Uncharacterized protein n=1 Tax=Protea cynaroides TaxID=273540 RepID=A0A9Q0KM02_9MAGN|nr:hypothetical protein NE237_006145 [Protea cynaroides]
MALNGRPSKRMKRQVMAVLYDFLISTASSGDEPSYRVPIGELVERPDLSPAVVTLNTVEKDVTRSRILETHQRGIGEVGDGRFENIVANVDGEDEGLWVEGNDTAAFQLSCRCALAATNLINEMASTSCLHLKYLLHCRTLLLSILTRNKNLSCSWAPEHLKKNPEWVLNQCCTALVTKVTLTAGNEKAL